MTNRITTIPGRFTMEPGKEYRLPLGTGRGRHCVAMVSIVRVIRYFTKYGMTMTEVEIN